MKIEQKKWTESGGWKPEFPAMLANSAQLVLVFGSTYLLKVRQKLEKIQSMYPKAYLFGCSTAGEISGAEVSDDTVVITAIHFEHTEIQCVKIKHSEMENSFQAGERLAQDFIKEGLTHVIILASGLCTNGSELVNGLATILPEDVAITGGLSGDGVKFSETLVLYDNEPVTDAITALGLYGDRITVGYGSSSAWEPFGPLRLITHSIENVLYELDGKSAIELYKSYVGNYGKNLQTDSLYFPLCIKTEKGDGSVLRSILALDEQDNCITFAGNVPKGSYAQLTMVNFDALIDGAKDASLKSYNMNGSSPPDLVFLVSCVGRKLVMDQRIEEEVESVLNIMGCQSALCGFYSYGQISPVGPGIRSQLHNHTMTVTTLTER